MRLVAVTRIMNEDDIVEAFVRHHQGQIDHHLFLDNGSVDRTVEILLALKAEGVKLTVLQSKSSFHVEANHSTTLFQIAARQLGADWVLFLDTDEFVDSRATPDGLRARIEALPPEVDCLSVVSVNYYDKNTDDAGELVVARRMSHRGAVIDRSNTKVFVRTTLAGLVQIDSGQHKAIQNRETVPSRTDEALLLAHYYRRGPHQMVWKNLVGRLKVFAAGRKEIDQGRGEHYIGPYELLRDAPERLLRDPGWMAPSYAWENLVDDPIRYEGEDLRYTRPMDGPMKAIRVMLGYGEQLATDFGAIIDSNEGVRMQVEKKALVWTKLF
jgi:hypothetical protein